MSQDDLTDTDMAAVLEEPQRFFASPISVAKHRGLAECDKKRILEIWQIHTDADHALADKAQLSSLRAKKRQIERAFDILRNHES